MPTDVFSVAGVTQWVCPANVTKVTVTTWGGGGGGGSFRPSATVSLYATHIRFYARPAVASRMNNVQVWGSYNGVGLDYMDTGLHTTSGVVGGWNIQAISNSTVFPYYFIRGYDDLYSTDCSELEFWSGHPDSGGTKLPALQTFSGTPYPGFHKDYAFDGDINTGWAPDGSSTDQCYLGIETEASSTVPAAGGGAGGGGAKSILVDYPVTAGTSYRVEVGAGGTTVASNGTTNGSQGGVSSFVDNNTCSAWPGGGGWGGDTVNSGLGGAGGAAASGAGTTKTSGLNGGSASGATGGTPATQDYGMGGLGGSSTSTVLTGGVGRVEIAYEIVTVRPQYYILQQ